MNIFQLGPGAKLSLGRTSSPIEGSRSAAKPLAIEETGARSAFGSNARNRQTARHLPFRSGQPLCADAIAAGEDVSEQYYNHIFENHYLALYQLTRLDL